MSVLAGRKNAKLDSRLIITPLLAILVLLASCSRQKAAEPVAPKTFATPAAAGAALFDAAKAGDQNALVAIFGPDGKELVFSGDAVKDKNTRQRFVEAYTQMNRWSKSKSGDEILYIGADNFPFPIPLKQDASSQWAFDTAAGKNEILARRIGDGELTAIGVLTELADAQQEYFSRNREFAQKFISEDGQHNGLYWPAAEGQRPSPLHRLGELAKAMGYSRSDKPQPFNGYYYKMLTQQGDKAKGGAKDYMASGKMAGGFAILAWPAKYRDSGIMTFMVGKDGVIYEKDLGENSAQAAATITAYNPGDGWSVVLAPEPANAALVPKSAKK